MFGLLSGSAVTAMDLTDILSNAGEVLTSALGWVGTVANYVTSNPVLAIGLYCGLAWLAFNAFRKLTRIA